MTINNKTKRACFAALLTVALGACEFIDPVTSNPNAVPTGTVDQLFTGVQVNTIFLAGGGLSRISAVWTQQMFGEQRQFATFDDYVITDSDFDDEFDALYTGGGLVDLHEAIQQAEDAGRIAYAGILKVHEAFMVGTIASYYGDIPYTEAVDESITEPALDDQAAVYAAVQALLDEAIIDLGGGGAGPGAIDISFGGDTSDWIAVANTLKARFHMHWAESDASRYATARGFAQNGVTTVGGTWRANFGASATENNLWYQFQRDRSGYVVAGEYLPALMNANADPRRGFYFDAVPAPVNSGDLSATGFGSPTFDQPIVTCAETYFIIAEAELMDGTADEAAAIAAARNALACEEAQYGLAADDLGSVTGFTGLTGAPLFDAIMEQKYIAQFLNPDAFNDYKRTCRPAITERAGGMPGRLYYSANERRTNSNIPDTGTDPNDEYNDNDPSPC